MSKSDIPCQKATFALCAAPQLFAAGHRKLPWRTSGVAPERSRKIGRVLVPKTHCRFLDRAPSWQKSHRPLVPLPMQQAPRGFALRHQEIPLQRPQRNTTLLSKPLADRLACAASPAQFSMLSNRAFIVFSANIGQRQLRTAPQPLPTFP